MLNFGLGCGSPLTDVTVSILFLLIFLLTEPRDSVPRDCYDIQKLCGSKSGIYYIFPHTNDAGVEVYCDMKTDKGGWLVSEFGKQNKTVTPNPRVCMIPICSR